MGHTNFIGIREAKGYLYICIFTSDVDFITYVSTWFLKAGKIHVYFYYFIEDWLKAIKAI